MADLFRIDLPVIPAHVTCLRSRAGELWLRTPNGWLPPDADDETPAISERAMVYVAGTLVEHPDPRKD